MANISFYTAVSGMKAFQQMMDITGNNLSNVTTNGYKKQRASFEDLLYTRVNQKKNYAPGATAEGGDNVDLRGHGVRVASEQLVFSATGYVATDMPLDFAIEGDGLFAVNKNGETFYTRSGAFSLSRDGKSYYLIASDGSRVLDTRGKEIKLSMDENDLPVYDDLAERIGIYHFSNPYGLTHRGKNLFSASDVSGPGVAQKQGQEISTAHQFMLENSNVDMGDEMVNIIQAQRAFQMNARMVQTADQIEETVNSLRK